MAKLFQLPLFNLIFQMGMGLAFLSFIVSFQENKCSANKVANEWQQLRLRYGVIAEKDRKYVLNLLTYELKQKKEGVISWG
ncbi:hypothetical protein [Lysinibacillus sp. 38-6]|uniref:hypothetical protein n=1 Tax=Lysinibacillus sp. 38-6 TaxID=3385991 RepID=UPI003908B3B2